MLAAGALVLLSSCDMVTAEVPKESLRSFANGADCELVVWLKAFINPWATNPSYIEHVLPPSAHEDEPALTAGSLADVAGSDLFLTDYRTFSSDPSAPARMHSEIRFIIRGTEAPLLVDAGHWTGTTIGIDRSVLWGDYAEDRDTCTKTAGTAGMSWGAPQVFGTTTRTTKVRLDAAGSNPCAPSRFHAIDYAGDLMVTNSGGYVRVRFSGAVDGYPSYEMYARDSDGKTSSLFQISNFGGNPTQLYGGPDVYTNGAISMCVRDDRGGIS